MFGMKSDRPYNIRKSRDILREGFAWFQKKKEVLPAKERQSFEDDLRNLDKFVLSGDRAEANRLARKVENFLSGRVTKGIFHYTFEIVVALVIALVIATFVRQMWFEIYEIPTGSMRPTFKEKDHVTVSKTAFGVNFPLKTDHLYFDPSLVKRTGVIIFTADNLPLRDVDATYFGILPYKKRFIKRLIGKPGDTLYFYGGKIYGVDKDGQEIRDILDSPNLENLEYVPFLSFGGDISEDQHQVIFHQMHQPIGRLISGGFHQAIGQVLRGRTWVVDNPTAQKTEHDEIETYSDFWGMRNFAMARLLTKTEVIQYTDFNTSDLDDSVLYLELRHTPSLTYPQPDFSLSKVGSNWFIPAYKTIIPLKQEQLNKIMESMYTARFVVGKGRGKRYQVGDNHFRASNPLFPTITDGTYEFYNGTAYSIGIGGHATKLDKSHPIYQNSPEMIQKLFNQGIDFNTAFDPSDSDQTIFPRRYAYFRDGDLYLLGSSILEKDHPTLLSFHKKELDRQKNAPRQRPYVAFKDYGPPYKDGNIDTKFLKTFGLTIPDKHYLVLGDNHAMSSDGRVFGFLPEQNIQGVPRLIIWPLGERWGAPNQLEYPTLTSPRIAVWVIAAIVIAGILFYQQWRNRRSLFRD